MNVKNPIMDILIKRTSIFANIFYFFFFKFSSYTESFGCVQRAHQISLTFQLKLSVASSLILNLRNPLNHYLYSFLKGHKHSNSIPFWNHPNHSVFLSDLYVLCTYSFSPKNNSKSSSSSM